MTHWNDVDAFFFGNKRGLSLRCWCFSRW